MDQSLMLLDPLAFPCRYPLSTSLTYYHGTGVTPWTSTLLLRPHSSRVTTAGRRAARCGRRSRGRWESGGGEQWSFVATTFSALAVGFRKHVWVTRSMG